jgi:twitching motility two-component system response regulator PilG
MREGALEQPEITIIVVDDSITIRKIVETSLSRAGYKVFGYADGITALRWLMQETNQVPGLILLDVDLPRMDGYKVAQHIRANPRLISMEIIMISGHDGIIDRVKGRLVGAKAYLTKPFRTADLLSMVQQYLHEA